MRIGFIVSLVFALIIAIFGIQNAIVISVNFFFTKINISLALIIFISAIVGAIIVTLLGIKKDFTLSRGFRQLTKKTALIKTEFEICKNENMTLNDEIKSYNIKIKTLETKNKIFNDEVDALNIEIIRLSTISLTKTTIHDN